MLYAGDDVAITYPVTDTTPGGQLTFTATIKATTTPDAAPVELAGDWQGPPGSPRDLKVSLITLTRGLWSLRLVIPDGGDLFLGNVYIE